MIEAGLTGHMFAARGRGARGRTQDYLAGNFG